MTGDSLAFDEADSDSDGKLSESELQALTVTKIKAIATEKGYTITKTLKAEIIAEFLQQQG